MTIRQILMKLERKLLTKIIVISILLLQNLISHYQKDLLQDQNKQIQQAKVMLLILQKKKDIDNNLSGFNKRINSNKTIHVLVEDELNELSEKAKLLTKDYSFFLGKNYFTSNDVSQNTFVY